MPGAPKHRALTRARAGVACAVACAVCSSAGTAAASPQWNLALSPGGCYVRGSGAEDGWALCGSASGYVLFLRERDRDFGVGPYARGLMVLGDSMSAGAGVSALLPISPTFPFVLSAGAVANTRDGEISPGADLWLFWGPSSYNFHSSYSMASGLLVGAQKTWGAAPATTLMLGAQIDFAFAAIPFIALYEVMRGAPER